MRLLIYTILLAAAIAVIRDPNILVQIVGIPNADSLGTLWT